jgi:hypothetical protein
MSGPGFVENSPMLMFCRSAHRFWSTDLVAIPLVIFTFGCSSGQSGSFIQQDDQGWSIAKYTRSDIDNAVDRLRGELGEAIEGHIGIERNSSGTEIFLYTENLVVVLNRQGAADVYRKPGQHARLNDKHNFVSWYSDDGRLTFSSGSTMDVPSDMTDLIFSPGSRYFLITRQSDSKSSIYSVESPTVVQAEVELVNPVLTDGRAFLYVAGNDPSETEEIKVYVYRKDEERLQLERTQTIARPSGRCCSPFYVSDIHADKDVIALVDSSDKPLSFLSTLYVSMVRKNSLSKAGKPGPHMNLFLEYDILSEYLGR